MVNANFKRIFNLKCIKKLLVLLILVASSIYLYYIHRYHLGIVGGLYSSYVSWHILQIEDGKIPISIPNSNNLSSSSYPHILIGIGVMKCGTTFLLDSLSLSNYNTSLQLRIKNENNQNIFTRIINYDNNNNMYFLQALTPGELKYWTWCWLTKCSFSNYILSNFNMTETETETETETNRIVVYTEKTPTYIREPHIAKLLGYYSSIISTLKIYIILRNPIKRLWSHAWYNCKYRLKICDYNFIMSHIWNQINLFRINNPYWNKMFSLIDSDSESSDINKLILYYYQNGWYSISNLIRNNDIIVTSCYYPQIILWWKYLKNKKSLKIFQFNDLKTNISKLIYEIRNWISADNIHNNHNYVNMQIDRNKILRRNRIKNNTQSRNIPIKLIKKLRKIFNSSNYRLYQFIDNNPHILLKNHKFNHW